MILPCIVTISKETKEKCENFLKEIKKDNLDIDKICSNKFRDNGYAQYTVTGTLLPEYEDIDELKLAILVDDRYSFFGGNSTIDRNTKKFKVVIYVD